MGCSAPVSPALPLRDDSEDLDSRFELLVSCTGSLSLSLPVGLGIALSIAVPGVLGVLVDEPKDAKAPDPRPKAEEAPLVGEETPVVVTGAMPLSGVLPPIPCSPPNRLLAEKECGLSGLLVSLVVVEVDREFLLELGKPIVSVAHSQEYR